MGQILFYLNLLFTVIYVVEFSIKIIGLGLRYFKVNFNLLDLIVTLCHILAALINFLSENTSYDNGRTYTNALRALVIIRLLKLFRKHQSLNSFLQAFILTLPSILNIAALLLLFFFIYSVIATNFFSQVKLTYPLSEHINFQNFANSCLSLFILHTGEIYFEMLNALKRQNSIIHQCNENYSFEEFSET